MQREIIVAALQGHDVFVMAATSFGKSLCYQLPAVIDHGITICVSPLLALMKNQVEALEAAGVAVATVNGKTEIKDRDKVLSDLRCGHPRTRLLYVTPEYCLTETFRRLLQIIYKQNELARIAIDEAHCISEWGHDFRRSYLQLNYFRKTFPKTPIICLTATATPEVRSDVISALSLDASKLKIFSTSTFRSNLHYEVRFYSEEHDDRFESLRDWIQSVYKRRSSDSQRKQELESRRDRFDAVSGIVYANYRSECEMLAQHLREAGIGAKPYHAGLPHQERMDCQTKWVASEPGYDVIVATTAFGMGIDKENVRFIVHWSLPKSFEGYYQEAGRAGRDGRASLCMLFYSREDRDRSRWRLTNSGAQQPDGRRPSRESIESKAKTFQKLIEYCENVERCRHELITEYFKENVQAGVCDFACDRCKDRKGLKQRRAEGLASEEWVSTQRESGNLRGNSGDYD